MGNLKPPLQRINHQLIHLIAQCYEDVAIEILRGNQDKIFPFYRIGRWWNRNHEIDVVAFDDTNEHILFAEVKWSSKPVGIDIYNSLKMKAKEIEHPYEKAHFAFFCRSGFTKDMIELAKTEKIFLFTGNKMINFS